MRHAAVPCEGIGLNREYDRDAPPLAEVLREDWRPAKPELTDTICHVITVESAGELIGFLSYFGCHPVVCCETTRYIHGDFVGVATNLLEREHPSAVGLFLQGAQGDVNSCVVHKPEPDSMLALDVIAARYANQVRAGMRHATPLAIDRLDAVSLPPPSAACSSARKNCVRGYPSRKRCCTRPMPSIPVARCAWPPSSPSPIAACYSKLPPAQRTLNRRPAHFSSRPAHFARDTVRDLPGSEKRHPRARHFPTPLLLGLTDDALGYAPDHAAAARGGYAAQVVPLMLGSLPFRAIHDELATQVLILEERTQRT